MICRGFNDQRIAHGLRNQNTRRSWYEGAAGGTGLEIFDAPIQSATHFAKFARRDGSVDDCVETNGGTGLDDTIALMLPEEVHQKVAEPSHQSPGNQPAQRG